MSAQKAFTDRGVAESKHANVLRRLLGEASQPAPNKRTIKNSLAQLNQAWDVLVEKHVTYVYRMSQTLDKEDHKNWMETKSDAHEEGVKRAEFALGLIETGDGGVTEGRDTEDVKEEISHLKLRINARLAAVNVAITQPMSLEQHAEITSQGKQLQEMVLTDLKALSMELRDLDGENADRHRKDNSDYIASKIPELDKLVVDIASKKPGPTQGQVVGGNVPAQVATGVAREERQEKKQARLTPVAAPTFSGRSQDFGHF